MKYFISIISAILFFSSLYSQSYIGIKAGFSNSSFYKFASNEEYITNYEDYNNYLFSFSYKEKYNKNHFYGLEIENKTFKSNAKIEYLSGYSSFYSNIQYELNYITTYFMIENSFSINRKIIFSINTSPFVGYLISSKAEGIGWDYVYKTQIDTSGNEFSYITIENWTKNETNTDDLVKLNVGIRIGIGITIPLYERFALEIKNLYCFGINNVMRNVNSNYTSNRSIDFSIGITYSLNKKLLKIKEHD